MTSSLGVADIQQLLSTYRSTLFHYVNQHAIFGSAYAPPAVMHGIRETCSAIRRLKGVLREEGLSIDDSPNDDFDLISFGQQIGVEQVPTSKFSLAKFEAYRNTWESLQSLKLLGDELWRRANNENIFAFAQQLQITSAIVRNSAIFFEDEDYHDLLQVLEEFGEFRMGKIRLLDIRTRREERYINTHYAEIQVDQNRQYKQRYDMVLENIRRSFNTKLSRLT